MTFEEFLAYVRKHIGKYCTDEYWRAMYNMLVDKSVEHIKHEMPFLAVSAVGTHYATIFADEDFRNVNEDRA